MNLWMGNDPFSRLARIRRVRRRMRRLAEFGRPKFVIEIGGRTTPQAWASGAFTGALAGSALMFWLDPVSGRRRRALTGDKLGHLARQTSHGLDAARRDLAHRMRGMAAETAGRLRRDDGNEGVIAQRVRTALGRVVSHPHALEVRSHDGVVELSGPILRRELASAIAHARKVRGVKRVDDRLDAYEDADHIPALQGGKIRRERFELLQEHWTPGPRLLTGIIGMTLVGTAATARDARLGWPLGLTGAALLARSATNKPAKTLFGRLERPGAAVEGYYEETQKASEPGRQAQAGESAGEPDRSALEQT